MKKIYRLLLFITFCCVSVIMAEDVKGNDDSAVSRYNKAQKEHIKIYITYATSNADKMSKEDMKKVYNDYYKPISTWCSEAQKLYEQSSQNIQEKIENTENVKRKQQLNFISMKYDQAANLCQSIQKGYSLNDRNIMEKSINQYIKIENEMKKLKINHPVREWISSEEGEMELLHFRHSKKSRQIQPRQPQPRQPRPQPIQP